MGFSTEKIQKKSAMQVTQQVDIDESGTLDAVELRKLIRKFQEKVPQLVTGTGRFWFDNLKGRP